MHETIECNDIESDDQEPQQPALEPVEQESIAFHGDTIIAVRLEDGRIAVVLRWICESLKIRPHGQVNRIKRTAAITGELVRVKVQTRGGRQDMPALTLRGFPTWILGLNPNEVKDDPDHPEQAERIRQMIIAYQLEAVDVLYNHFAQKAQLRSALPEPGQSSAAVITREQTTELEPIRPVQEPGPGASHGELATYHEAMALWHRWKADRHAQAWRGEVQIKLEDQAARLEEQEARLESEKAMLDLIPEILERIGPETINSQQQRQVQAYVRQLSEVSGKHPATIYDNLKTAFDCPRYKDLKEDEWPQVVKWFKIQLDRARK